jgi:hypothetical protein
MDQNPQICYARKFPQFSLKDGNFDYYGLDVFFGKLQDEKEIEVLGKVINPYSEDDLQILKTVEQLDRIYDFDK